MTVLPTPDPAKPEGSLAARSRDFAVASYQIFMTDPTDPHNDGPYNAELVIPLSAEMATVIDALVPQA